MNFLMESAWAWDFGDGMPGSNLSDVLSHTFPASGTFLVTLTVENTAGQMDVATVLVALDPTAELASPDQVVAELGTPLLIAKAELLANDASGVAFHSFDQPQASGGSPPGSLANENAAYLKYTPPASFSGSQLQVSFVYRVADATGRTQAAIVSVTVVRPDPVANPDFFTTGINVSLFFTVAELLENDEPSPQQVVFGGTKNAVNGAVVQLPPDENGLVLYEFRPRSNWAGAATFEYTITHVDGGNSVDGLVTVEVVDRGPWADFWFRGCTNRTCNFEEGAGDDVLINNYLWEWGDGQVTSGPFAEIVSHTYANQGPHVVRLTVTDSAGHTSYLRKMFPAPDPKDWGKFEYPPGKEEFRVVSDTEVIPNTPPVAVGESYTTDRDVSMLIDPKANDSDADPNALLTVFGDWTSLYPGMVVAVVPDDPNVPNGPFKFRVTPPDGFLGTLTLPYRVHDGFAYSNWVDVALQVNQWTSITDARGEQFKTGQNLGFQFSRALLLSNDFDENNNPPGTPVDTIEIVGVDTSLLMGSLTPANCLTSTQGVCWYSPPSNAAGMTYFKYTIEDDVGHRDTATVRIYVGNMGQPPTAVDDYFFTTRPNPKVFTVQDVVQNDIDPDGDTLTIGVGTASDWGAFACGSPVYLCTYTPKVGFIGHDRIQYSASDGVNAIAGAYINVTTLPEPEPNRKLDAREDLRTTNLNQQLFISRAGLLSNDYDPEGQPITITSVDTGGMNGTLTPDGVGYLYQPGLNFSGVTQFRYTATDSQGNTDVGRARIRVASPGNPAVSAPDAFTTPRNRPITFSIFDLMINDYDPDNDPMDVTIYPVLPIGERKGTMSCSTPAYWCTFTPNATGPANETETINYSVTGAAAGSTFTIAITPNVP